MEGVDNDHTEAPMRIERFEQRVPENDDRYHGHEEIQRDHQGQVPALDLAVPAGGPNEEPDPSSLLEPGSALLRTADPLVR
jgi:hypothetical protein